MDYTLARQNMIKSQIHPNWVNDPVVLAVMENLPREAFVPERWKDVAYVDKEIDLGNGRVLMEPLVMARLLQMAEIRSTDVVLELGCDTGYGASLLGRMASTVVAIEPDAEMSAKASVILPELGIDNVAVITAPLMDGYPAQAPYDVIFVNGAIPEISLTLLDQLADGGRLVAVVRGESGMGRAVVVTRTAHGFGRRELFDASASFLSGWSAEQRFMF